MNSTTGIYRDTFACDLGGINWHLGPQISIARLQCLFVLLETLSIFVQTSRLYLWLGVFFVCNLKSFIIIMIIPERGKEKTIWKKVFPRDLMRLGKWNKIERGSVSDGESGKKTEEFFLHAFRKKRWNNKADVLVPKGEYYTSQTILKFKALLFFFFTITNLKNTWSYL